MVYIDVPQIVADKLFQHRRSHNELLRSVIAFPQDVLAFDLNSHVSRPGQNGGLFVATGDDPSIEIPVSLRAERVRYCVITMACSGQERADAQLFWSGEKRAGYNEDLSIKIPLHLDGRDHTYIIDLHEGSCIGSINSRWRHPGWIRRIRFDPLNKPGEFLINQLCFLDEEYFNSDSLRLEAGLAPIRRELSFRYMNGWGIELGALENPLPVPPTSYVQYADRLTLEQARREYPELSGWGLVNPTIICDATALTMDDEAVDFLIANHVLEHMRDPLGALQEWLRVVRAGGHLYIAVPEHTNPLDKHRTVTPLKHLISDFEDRAGRIEQDLAHYSEWVASVNYEAPAAEQTRIAKDLIAKDYAIHFHTFNRETFAYLLSQATGRFSGELLEYRISVHPELVEFIAILRKGTRRYVSPSTSQDKLPQKIGRVLEGMRRRMKRAQLPTRNG